MRTAWPVLGKRDEDAHAAERQAAAAAARQVPSGSGPVNVL